MILYPATLVNPFIYSNLVASLGFSIYLFLVYLFISAYSLSPQDESPQRSAGL